MEALSIFLLALLLPASHAQSSISRQLQSSQLSGFLKLMEHADVIPEVESAFREGKSLTIFAPMDEALMETTSPTLLALLNLETNRPALRQVLLSHFVPQRLSPFQWKGAFPTLSGSSMQLSMDASAFYAQHLPVKQYNALVSDVASVHSIPSLFIPPGLEAGATAVVEEAADVRRVLQGRSLLAPAPAPVEEEPEEEPIPEPRFPPRPQEINSSPATCLVSLVATVCACLMASMLM